MSEPRNPVPKAPDPDDLRQDALRVMFNALLEISTAPAFFAETLALREVAKAALLKVTRR